MNRDIPIQFTPEYEAMLKRAEDKLRGNISSEKLTEEQTQAEIAAVTEGVFSYKPGETHTEIKPDGSRDIVTNREVVGSFMPPKRRGRPKGSKNKVK